MTMCIIHYTVIPRKPQCLTSQFKETRTYERLFSDRGYHLFKWVLFNQLVLWLCFEISKSL